MDRWKKYTDMSEGSWKVFTGGMAQTNGYLFEAPEGWVLVDAPDGVADWLDAEGIKVAALLLTHQHYDHVVDAAAVAESHGCPIYSHSSYSTQLTLEDLLRSAGMPVEVAPYEIDHLLAGLDSLNVAGMKFGLRFVPGHSQDSLCFVDEAGLRVFVGDTVFAGSVGRSDFPGGSHPLLISGITTHLLNFSDEVELLPGHGPATTVGAEKRTNPFLR